MPYTLNGIGTWYYGKNRLLTVHGDCSYCGSSGELKSYDTTNYFVILFIPIIPLGKFRIVEECAVCQQHRRIKLSDWEEQKASALGDLRTQMQSDGDQKQAALTAIQISVGFQDREMLNTVGEKFASRMTEDAEVQAQLGSAYAYFGDDERAIEGFRKSLKVKEDSDVSEYLAATLVRMKQPDEAEKHLQHLLNPGDPEKLGYLVLLAEGHQLVGNHNRACDLLEQCETLVPELEKDKPFQKMRKKAEKNRGSTLPAKKSILLDSSNSEYREGSKGSFIAKLAFPIILITAFLIGLATAWWKGANREVFVVNGTFQNYVALLNGKEVTVPARGFVKHKIAEGEIEMSIQGREDIESATVKIETPFFSRIFKSPTYILNPDRTSLIVWQKAWYGDHVNALPEMEYKLTSGVPIQHFEDIDYPFEPFPLQLNSSKYSKNISKTRVGIENLDGLGTALKLSLLRTSLSPEQLLEYAKNWASFDPNNEIAIGLWAMHSSPDEFLKWAEQRLDHQPVSVELHRAYQSTMDKHHPNHDLKAEYQKRLATLPGDTTLTYLLGRITEGHLESRRLLAAAASGNPPSPHAANAMAMDHLSMGEFALAVPYAETAISLNPNSMGFDSVYYDVMTAAGNTNKALDHIREKRKSTPNDIYLMYLEIQTAQSGPNPAMADEIITHLHQQLSAESNTLAESVVKHWRADQMYATGDHDGYVRTMRETLEGQPNFEVEFVDGKLNQAAQVLNNEPEHSGGGKEKKHLLLYCGFSSTNQHPEAQSQLRAAIKILEQGSADERKLAAALSDTGSSNVDELLTLDFRPSDKRIFLTALGYRYPVDRTAYWKLAKTLNFHRSVPYLFLKKILK